MIREGITQSVHDFLRELDVGDVVDLNRFRGISREELEYECATPRDYPKRYRNLYERCKPVEIAPNVVKLVCKHCNR